MIPLLCPSFTSCSLFFTSPSNGDDAFAPFSFPVFFDASPPAPCKPPHQLALFTRNYRSSFTYTLQQDLPIRTTNASTVYSKNPYLLRNHVIPKEAIVGVQEPQGRRPQQMPRWGSCDFSMGMGSCFYPMTPGNKCHSECWKIVHFPAPNFSTDFDTGHGIIM